jgi:hypothetical protein
MVLGAVAALSCSTLEVEEARIGLRSIAAGIERQ